MATRLKPTRINVDNTPRVGDGASYQNDDNFRWSMGGGDMSYRDFEWHTLTGTSLVIEEISNNITPSSDFTVSAGTVKPGIEYVLRVNTGNTAYTMTLGTGVTNPNGYNTELEPNTVNQFKFIATSATQLELEGVDSAVVSEINWGEIGGTLSNQTDLQTALNAKQDNMVILKYGTSTWNDFITAYNKNAVVYCRASSNSNPATGSQTRLAFMAYVSNETTPTSVEFQYYRSRSDHNTQANQLDEVYVYKLESNGTWSVTQRNTAAKAVAGTGIDLAFGSGNMTISADTSVLATQTDLNSKQDTLVSGTNIKTVNNESLLGSGNITISAPTYTAGENIQISSSNVISATNTEYNAGPGIEIGAIQDYSAMRGPCPEGFHVPSQNELTDLRAMAQTLGIANRDSFKQYLKIPNAGLRTSTGSYSQSSMYLWSCTSSNNSAYRMDVGTSSISVFYNDKALGQNIRGFRDTPVTPDNSWTTLFDGSSIATGAGTFHNPTLGLISISGDGENWITIADKNLGATTVFNQGDVLTDANCGYFYQWGNNYGFSHSGTIATSSTQVDASGYGPGNYYSSSTYITRSSRPYNWDSSNNQNLRGGVTGVVTIDNAITNTGVLSVNGQTGDITVEEGITKIFTLSSTSDLTNAQAAYDWWTNGGNPIIKYSTTYYQLSIVTSSQMKFGQTFGYGAVSAGTQRGYFADLKFIVSSGSVTSIEQTTNQIYISSSVPNYTNNVITFVI